MDQALITGEPDAAPSARRGHERKQREAAGGDGSKTADPIRQRPASR
jgi:hypothetical protein